MKLLKIILICLASITALAILFLFVIAPILIQPQKELSPLAQAWRDSGKYISWRSTLEKNKSFGGLDIFTIQKGNPENPAILMIHGYPTSSFDFYELFEILSNDYYVCALDTPGYGLSDKPRDGYVYSIKDDARLVDYYIRDILKLNSLVLYTHDKGDSVGLALLKLYTQQDEYKITHHFITNGNIYLPLADLKRIQLLLLNKRTGPFITRYISGKRFAKRLNTLMHTIPEPIEKVDAVASNIDYQDGGKVQHDIIQYLDQRHKHEDEWLANLQKSIVPATIIWGVDDPVATLKVSDFVWDNILKNRQTKAYYWQLPMANHYLQNDQPEVVNLIIRQALGEQVDFSRIDKDIRPISVDR
jgi:pimeloyl-ACP methyl ester carboxylesterase